MLYSLYSTKVRTNHRTLAPGVSELQRTYVTYGAFKLGAKKKQDETTIKPGRNWTICTIQLAETTRSTRLKQHVTESHHPVYTFAHAAVDTQAAFVQNQGITGGSVSKQTHWCRYLSAPLAEAKSYVTTWRWRDPKTDELVYTGGKQKGKRREALQARERWSYHTQHRQEVAYGFDRVTSLSLKSRGGATAVTAHTHRMVCLVFFLDGWQCWHSPQGYNNERGRPAHNSCGVFLSQLRDACSEAGGGAVADDRPRHWQVRD